MRIEPPPSLPRCSGPMPVAAATAAPALLPPGVRSRFQGLRVMPVSGLSPIAFQPNSGVVVLPSSTAPCSRRRATIGASSSQGWSRRTDLGAAQRRPAARDHDVLDRGRHAVDQALRRALHPARLRRPGSAERGLLVDQQEGVERRLQRGDARQHRLGRFDGRQRLAAVVLERAPWRSARSDCRSCRSPLRIGPGGSSAQASAFSFGCEPAARGLMLTLVCQLIASAQQLRIRIGGRP